MDSTTNYRTDSVAATDTAAMSALNFLHPSVSWRSIVAGVLISLFAFACLASLGVAFGGVSLASTDNVDAGRVGAATVGWIVLSSALSLFIASYFAARISNFRPRRIGMAQAAVVTAIFFGVLLSQSAMLVGSLGRAAGSFAGSAVSATGGILNSQVVADLVEDNVSDLRMNSENRVVVAGVANRLLRGDTESAKAYLASQTGMSVADVDARINAIQSRVNAAMNDARENAAAAMQASGWSLFATLILGLFAAIGGGALGSRANIRMPMTVVEPKSKAYKAAYAS